MSLSLVLNQPFVSVGLPTFAYTVPTGGAGIYSVRVTLSDVPPSGISILIKKNGVTTYTVPIETLSATQNFIKYKTPPWSLADADAVTVVLASAEAVDNQLNTVKVTCAIQQGA